MSNMTEDIIIDNGSKTFEKRKLDLQQLGCPVKKRGKVFSHFLSEQDDPYDFQVYNYSPTIVKKSQSSATIPTAADYANLVFCSSSDEDESPKCPEVPMKSTNSYLGICRKKQRRTISFGESLPTVHYLHSTPLAREMTPEEVSTMWLNSQEIAILKSSAMASIEQMRKLITIPRSRRTTFQELMLQLERDTGSSIRGLEHRVFRRRGSRQTLINDVLECQKHIHGLEKFGHEMSVEEKAALLANVSLKRSIKSINEAKKLAQIDFKEVSNDGNRTDIL